MRIQVEQHPTDHGMPMPRRLHFDGPKPRTGFRCRSADLWRLGARSLPEPQPLSARASAGSLSFEPAFLSFAIHQLKPHNARARTRAYWSQNTDHRPSQQRWRFKTLRSSRGIFLANGDVLLTIKLFFSMDIAEIFIKRFPFLNDLPVLVLDRQCRAVFEGQHNFFEEF